MASANRSNISHENDFIRTLFDNDNNDLLESDGKDIVDLSIRSVDDAHPITQIVTGCLGCIGNVLTIFVWQKVKPFNSTSFLLMFLAVCDLGFLATAIAINVYHLVEKTTQTYAAEWASFVVIYVSYVAQYCSVFTTLLVSMARYLAVKFPIRIRIWFRKSRLHVMIVIIGINSVLLAIPSAVALCVIPSDNPFTMSANTSMNNSIFQDYPQPQNLSTNIRPDTSSDPYEDVWVHEPDINQGGRNLSSTTDISPFHGVSLQQNTSTKNEPHETLGPNMTLSNVDGNLNHGAYLNIAVNYSDPLLQNDTTTNESTETWKLGPTASKQDADIDKDYQNTAAESSPFWDVPLLQNLTKEEPTTSSNPNMTASKLCAGDNQENCPNTLVDNDPSTFQNTSTNKEPDFDWDANMTSSKLVIETFTASPNARIDDSLLGDFLLVQNVRSRESTIANKSTNTTALQEDSESKYPEINDEVIIIEVCALLNERWKSAVFLIQTITLNIFPWIVIVPFNFLLIQEVKKSFAERNRILSTEERDSNSMNLVVVLITMLSIVSYPVFFFLQFFLGPCSEVFRYIVGLDYPGFLDFDQYKNVILVQEILYMVNSSLNFVAYFTCGQRFRTIFFEEICKLKKGPQT